MYNVKIDKNNAISIFKDGNDTAMIYQETYPNGDQFLNYSDATNWANLLVESLNSEIANFPPIGQGIPAVARYSKTSILEILIKDSEKFGDDVPEQLAYEIEKLQNEIDNLATTDT